MMSDNEPRINGLRIIEGWENAPIIPEDGKDFPICWDNRINGKISKKILIARIIFRDACCYVRPSALRKYNISPHVTSLCNFSDPQARIAEYIGGIPVYNAKITIPRVRTDTIPRREKKTPMKLKVTQSVLHHRNQVRIETKDRSTVIITHGSDIAKKLIEKFSGLGQEWYPLWPDRLVRHPALNEEEIKIIVKAIEEVEIPPKERH